MAQFPAADYLTFLAVMWLASLSIDSAYACGAALAFSSVEKAFAYNTFLGATFTIFNGFTANLDTSPGEFFFFNCFTPLES